MQWSSLGVVKPTLQWQLYNVPVVGTETFRVTQALNVRSFYGMKAYVGQFFGSIDQVLVSKTIYPRVDIKEFIELKIPQEFKDAGNITRYIGIKLGNPRRLGVTAYNWTVELEELM